MDKCPNCGCLMEIISTVPYIQECNECSYKKITDDLVQEEDEIGQTEYDVTQAGDQDG